MAVITVTTEPVAEPVVPSVTFYQQHVDALMGAVDKVSDIIPRISEAEAAAANEVRRNLGVPVGSIAAAINAVEQLPQVAAANKLDPARIRLLLQFIEASTPLYDQLSAVSRRLRYALRAAKSEAGTATLHVLRICQSIASDERSPVVEAHMVAIRRDLPRRKTTKAEREARKAQKIREEVEKAMIRHGVDRTIIDRFREETEMKKAA